MLSNESESTLLAGVGRCDITPAPGTPQGGWGAQTHERGSSADMQMLVTVLALQQGDTKIVILDMDAIGFDQEWTQRIVTAVSSLTALAPENIRFSCTHTHSGANTFRLKNIAAGLDMAMSYLESLPHAAAGAAWQALQTLEPVFLASAMGESFINRNRRVQAPDGETIVGVNEDMPADHSFGVMRIDRKDGSTVATVLHYACHPTTIAWQSDQFTPDYPGVARQVIEKELGGVCIFLQGAAGDLGPRRGFTGDLDVYRKLGQELGLAAASVACGIATQPERYVFDRMIPSGANIALYRTELLPTAPPLAVRSVTLHLPIKPLPDVASLEKQLDVMRDHVTHLRAAGDMDAMRIQQAKATQLGWRLENARRYGHLKTTEWPMQVIRIGDTAFVSVAGEPFSSIGTRIRNASPADFTFVSGYSNGGFGYIPDREAYVSGGYEVEATPFSADAADIVVQQALEVITKMFEEKDKQ